MTEFRATLLTFDTIPDKLQEVIDRRRLGDKFKKAVGFSQESYTAPLKVSVLNEYAAATAVWFKDLYSTEVSSMRSFFRGADYTYCTPMNMYRVQYDIECTKDAIERYKGIHALDLDPKFQRGYVWTEKQKIAYIEYLIAGGVSGREIYMNCPNFQKDASDKMVIVDGKQRLNAIMEFAEDKFKVFKAASYSDLSYDDRSKVFWYCNINNIEDDAEVVKWYLSLNTGGSLHTAADLQIAKNVLRLLQYKIEDISDTI